MRSQELHVCGAEEDNAYSWRPYYTEALGQALTELTLLTKLHLEYDYVEDDCSDQDDFDDNGIADSTASLPSLQ